MTRQFSKIGVVGLGTGGAGIAEALARAGISVIAVEKDQESLARGQQRLISSTARAVGAGKLSEQEREDVLARIDLAADLAALAACEMVIEAVSEDLDLKTALFRRLDELLPPDVVLATNTSTMSVTHLAAATKRPSLVLGVHFFNPATVMGLIEVVHTVVTDKQVIEDVRDLAEQLGKSVVEVGDRAAFIVNALLFGYLNSALRMWDSRYATREDIDAAMRLGCGHPMGPLALLDLVGLDVAYAILDTLHQNSRDHLLAPAPILKQLVSAGFLGRKSGRGIYTYTAPDSLRGGRPRRLVRPAARARASRAHDRCGGHRDDGLGDHRGMRQVTATTSSSAPAARRRWPASGARWRGRWTRPSKRASSARTRARQRWAA